MVDTLAVSFDTCGQAKAKATILRKMKNRMKTLLQGRLLTRSLSGVTNNLCHDTP